MSYLRTHQARLILLSFLMSSLLLVAFPRVDISISTMFFDHGFYLSNHGWTKLLHECVPVFIVLSLVLVVGIYAFNKVAKRNICDIDGRKVSYLFLVLILGAGLIVNAALKDNFGRVRPRDVQEFGGSLQFTPAFVITDGCNTNCSFSSGDAAGAFFSLALALALSRRRAMIAAAVTFGVLVSFSRIAIGAHFFSDTVVSFFVMLVVVDVLYYYLLRQALERAENAVTASPGVPVHPLTKHSVPLS